WSMPERMARISSAISPAELAERSASLRTSSATTAKPLPCSPPRLPPGRQGRLEESPLLIHTPAHGARLRLLGQPLDQPLRDRQMDQPVASEDPRLPELAIPEPAFFQRPQGENHRSGPRGHLPQGGEGVVAHPLVPGSRIVLAQPDHRDGVAPQ